MCGSSCTTRTTRDTSLLIHTVLKVVSLKMASAQVAPRPYGSFRSRFGLSSSMNSNHTMTAAPMKAAASTYASRQRNPATAAVPPPAVPASPTSTPRLPRVVPDLSSVSRSTNQTNNSSAFVRNAKTTSSWDSRTFYSSSSAAAANKPHTVTSFDSNRQFRSSGGKAMAQQRSPNSSTGTSVESIVPKYGGIGLHDAYIFSGTSQKRVYNQNRAAKENVPASKKPQITKATVPGGSTGTATGTGTSSSSSSGRSSLRIRNFSSKFPQGLPFEDEFYKRRSHSVTSDTSKYSSYSSYDNNNNSNDNSLPFEDEFARKPSNEPLYVDFSKSIPAVAQAIMTPRTRQYTTTYHQHMDGCPSHHHHQHHHDQLPPSKTSNFFSKFETVSKGIGRPKVTQPTTAKGNQVVADRRPKVAGNNGRTGGAVTASEAARDQQVVYVAVASWVPRCNNAHQEQQLPANNANRVQLYVYKIEI